MAPSEPAHRRAGSAHFLQEVHAAMGLKRHGAIFLNGIFVLAPAIITGYVIVKAVWWLDATVRGLLERIGTRAFPGLGVVVGLVGIYLVGLLAKSWVLGGVIGLGERLVERIPLVKSLYSSVKDMLQFLGGGGDKESRGKPVMVELERAGVSLLGLVTQEKPDPAPPGQPDTQAVYLPMSYQLGGYTAYVPSSAVRPLEGVSVEELLRLCLTGGVGSRAGSKQHPQQKGD